MKLNFWGTVATLDGKGLTIESASQPVPDPTPPRLDVSEEDIFSGSRKLDKLRAPDRMEVLTDALERRVREQTGLEESFYELVIRVKKAESDLDREDGVPETVWNLNTRRLGQESQRLQALINYIDQAIQKMDLIRTHLKVVSFSASEVELQVARRDAISALDDFLRRSRKCRIDADRFSARLKETIKKLTG
ncbi:MAG: hypothetical protein AAGC81_00445 [Pseudomonadota bacterium]